MNDELASKRRARAPIALIHLTKMDVVAEYLRSEIIEGRLKPGTPLLQQEVAESLGVSPTPVREAFAVLEAEGLLVRRPHRGVIVAPRDFSRITQNYEIRVALEELAVVRLMNEGGRLAVLELERSLDQSRKTMRESNLTRFRRESTQFHALLGQLSGSAALSDMLDVLRNTTVFHPPLGGAGMRRVQRNHESIVKAINSGDATSAAAELRRHLQWNLEVARQAEEKRSEPSSPSSRRTTKHVKGAIS